MSMAVPLSVALVLYIHFFNLHFLIFRSGAKIVLQLVSSKRSNIRPSSLKLLATVNLRLPMVILNTAAP